MTNEMRLLADTCKKRGFDYYVENERIHITSKHDRWIIMSDPRSGKPTLYHRNKGLTACSPDSPILFYHLQNQAPHTYRGILKYIINHDRYANHSIVIQTKWSPPARKSKKDWDRKNCHSIEKRFEKKEKEGNVRRKKVDRINIKEMMMDSLSED